MNKLLREVRRSPEAPHHVQEPHKEPSGEARRGTEQRALHSARHRPGATPEITDQETHDDPQRRATQDGSGS